MTGTRLGFLSGFLRLFVAARWLLKRPSLWSVAFVPVLVFVLLECVFVTLAVLFLKPAVLGVLPEATSWYGRAGSSLLGLAAVAAAGAIGWMVAVPLAPALSAPALERLVGAVESDRAVPSRRKLGFFAEMLCGFRAMGAAFIYAAPVLLACWLLGFFLPVLAPLVFVLQLFLSSLAVAWGLFDYPLTLHGVGVRERYRFLNRHGAVVFGFGCAFMLAFWLPCCSVLLLPVGVIAATDLLWELLGHSPEELPQLARANASGSAVS